jgi:membrane protein DedA with SNARE-associated domain/rhodanese-related sulfurtransferase
MTETTQFLIDHGLPIVFAAVFLEQIGLPLPALPWLLAAGALAASGEYSSISGIGLTVLACVIADTFWFYLGRHRGIQVLGWLCRISLEPDSCVRRTSKVFTHHGKSGLIMAKFVPGLNTLAPPLAGMSGISTIQFVTIDAFASLLYGATIIGLGYFFSNQIEQIGTAIAHIGVSTLCLLSGLAALYIAYKYWQRQRLLRELRSARITVTELHAKLNSGENPAIYDLRSRAELDVDPTIIQGAIHLDFDDIKDHRHEFPHDRDIIIYCSCPNEMTSARLTLSLKRKGFTRVRPLQGGIEAWRKQKYPMETWTTAANAIGAVLTGRETVPATNH